MGLSYISVFPQNVKATLTAKIRQELHTSGHTQNARDNSRDQYEQYSAYGMLRNAVKRDAHSDDGG
jgi:hypothetical protein